MRYRRSSTAGLTLALHPSNPPLHPLPELGTLLARTQPASLPQPSQLPPATPLTLYLPRLAGQLEASGRPGQRGRGTRPGGGQGGDRCLPAPGSEPGSPRSCGPFTILPLKALTGRHPHPHRGCMRSASHPCSPLIRPPRPALTSSLAYSPGIRADGRACFLPSFPPPQVFEETGVRADFLSLLAIRHQHGAAFGRDDAYCVCLLEPRR